MIKNIHFAEISIFFPAKTDQATRILCQYNQHARKLDQAKRILCQYNQHARKLDQVLSEYNLKNKHYTSTLVQNYKTVQLSKLYTCRRLIYKYCNIYVSTTFRITKMYMIINYKNTYVTRMNIETIQPPRLTLPYVPYKKYIFLMLEQHGYQNYK